MSHDYYVYILTNQTRSTLYIGVTNSLETRLHQHRTRSNPKSFTAQNNLNRLVHYENFTEIESAIAREKQLKRWRRSKKNDLIAKHNPTWNDLAIQLLDLPPVQNVPLTPKPKRPGQP